MALLVVKDLGNQRRRSIWCVTIAEVSERTFHCWAHDSNFTLFTLLGLRKSAFWFFVWNLVSPPFYGRGLPNSDALLMCYNASFNDAVTLMVAWHFTVARFWPRVFSVCNAVHSAHLPMQRWENLYNLFFSYFFIVVCI